MDKHRVGPKIRENMSDGRLPTRRPTRTWFGFAQGDTSCAACGDPIANGALECEAEFPEESRTWFFHAACFEIWDAERITALTRARDGHPIDDPPGVTVNGNQAHAASVADAPRDDGASRVTRFLQNLSGGVRRAAREFISVIAPRRSVRPR